MNRTKQLRWRRKMIVKDEHSALGEHDSSEGV